MFLGGADFLINITFLFFATILFWIYKSATPGKLALKLKIVNASDGGKLSIGRYFVYFSYISIIY